MVLLLPMILEPTIRSHVSLNGNVHSKDISTNSVLVEMFLRRAEEEVVLDANIHHFYYYF